MEGPLRCPDDPGFRLIETGLWRPGEGMRHRALHLARLRRTASRFGITPRGVEAALDALTGAGPLRLRLTVDRHGTVEITTQPFTPLPDTAVWRLGIASERLTAANPWLRVKTTERQLYDRARAVLPDGVEEMIFLNERGEVCEGTITNIFAETGAGLVTPPLSCGLLPGILRAHLLETGEAREATLSPDLLRSARALHVGNALRGLIPAQLVT